METLCLARLYTAADCGGAVERVQWEFVDLYFGGEEIGRDDPWGSMCQEMPNRAGMS